MDLRVYYQKLRQVEESLPEPYAVMVSQETPDGGRAGVLTEAPRALAARLIVEGGARLASEEEAAAFHRETAEARQRAEQAAAASRIQVTVVAEPAGDGKRPRAKNNSTQS
ncbi:MAG: hypothetical protein IT159_15495 [Bryobacterales bacterium]|jgi:hypothetical protein|nr:hypothetical protein [Bryobacterales bacterium]